MIKLHVRNQGSSEVREVSIRYRTFGGGEEHLYVEDDLSSEIADFFITLHFQESKDIINLMLLNEVIDRFMTSYTTKSLICKYIPFGRQDRVTNANEPFSLKVFSNLINSMEFTSVKTLDNHSTVTNALINNIEESSTYEDIKRIIDKKLREYATICSPDVGAKKKVDKIYESLQREVNHSFTSIFATKERDLISGDIFKTNIYGDVINKNIIIIDDICDGGRTFIELAKVLKDRGANKIALIVTHGIFSRGIEVLKDNGIDEVFYLNDLRK